MRLLDAGLPTTAKRMATRYRSIALDHQQRALRLASSARAARFTACAVRANQIAGRYARIADVLAVLRPTDLARLVQHIRTAPADEPGAQLVHDLLRAPLADLSPSA